MSLPQHMSSAGISRNTDSRLHTMDLMSVTPMSKPRRNFIKVIAVSPAMVVRLLAEISGMDIVSASMAASRIGFVLCSSL